PLLGRGVGGEGVGRSQTPSLRTPLPRFGGEGRRKEITATWDKTPANGGGMSKKKKKVRVDLRKNRSKPPRQRGWTRGFQEHGFAEEATTAEERVRAKGDLSRRRTIIQEETTAGQPPGGPDPAEMPAVDPRECLEGRVLRVQRLGCDVETTDGRQFRCVVRPLLL